MNDFNDKSFYFMENINNNNMTICKSLLTYIQLNSLIRGGMQF